MAGLAQLKFVMTECSKTQIRLTGLKYQICMVKISILLHYFIQQSSRMVYEKNVHLCPTRYIPIAIYYIYILYIFLEYLSFAEVTKCVKFQSSRCTGFKDKPYYLSARLQSLYRVTRNLKY